MIMYTDTVYALRNPILSEFSFAHSSQTVVMGQ